VQDGRHAARREHGADEADDHRDGDEGHHDGQPHREKPRRQPDEGGEGEDGAAQARAHPAAR
jgi:hypothetical protein